MQDLEAMQKKLLMRVFDIPYSSNEEKKEYIQLMREFLEKQKVLLFRMSLSDDPEAIKTKEKIMESAQIFGLKDGQSMNEFFEMLEKPIKEIENSFDV
jgi:CRISPR/Cas system-associated protein endoribonuclease Cas2